MATLLEQLRDMTTVVADSGDLHSIKKFKPQDSTTNPSLIAAASAMPEYQSIVDDVLKNAKKEAGDGADDKAVAAYAFKTLAVAFGRQDPGHRSGAGFNRGRRAAVVRFGQDDRAGARHHRAVR